MAVVALLRVAPVDPYMFSTVQPVRLEYEYAGARGEFRSELDFGRTNGFLADLERKSSVHAETVLDGVSMWQFLPSFVWPDLFRAVETSATIERFLDDLRPGAVRAVIPADQFERLTPGVLSAACERRGIAFEHTRGGGESVSALRRRVLRPLKSHALRASWGVPARVASRRASGRPRRAASRSVLFATSARHWVPVPGGRGRRYDEQLHPLLPSLSEIGIEHVVAVDCPQGVIRPALEALEERRSVAEPMLEWRAFLADAPLRVGLRRRELRARWETLRKDPAFGEACSFEGVPLLPALAETFSEGFSRLLPGCMRHRETARRLLDRERPAAVIANYETGPHQRALVIEAGLRGIPTLALMHGMVFENHYDYMHPDVATDPRERPEAYTIPSVTCVWGPFWKRVLTEAGTYPPGAVAVTGNWRHDRLVEFGREFDREDTRERLGIAPNERVVAVLASGQDIPGYIGAVLGALGSIEATRVLLRLHPSDDPLAVHPVLDAAGVPRSALHSGLDLFELLSIADAVVSQISTVVAESWLFGLPVVLVNFHRLSGWSAYEDSGAVVSVREQNELAPALRAVLDDERARERMAQARRALVGEWFGTPDGKAAERVAQVMSERLDQLPSPAP